VIFIKINELNSVLVKNIANFFTEQGKTKVVLGLSGGIDSALVLSLLTEAIGKSNVTAIFMPNKAITSDKSGFDAKKLAVLLAVKFFVVEIDGILASFSKLPWIPSDIAKANLNARTRALVLYNYANSTECLVAGTGNKSEFYMGYFTKYGDAAADFFPIGNLLKTQVRALSEYRGIPHEFLEKAPSAELWKGQEDEKEMGLTYAELDELLPLILEGKKIPAGKEKIGEKIKKQIKETEHKRQNPKIIPLSST